ncbi:MAG: glycosyltransferase family 4 protein, partial [Alphaproteobacteria bacterium]|nr:glycosyltransferase family 4 protein [Alphaproteobacteria bacterium]
VLLGSLAESLANFRGPLIREMVQRDYEVVATAPDAPEGIAEAVGALGARFEQVAFSRTGMNPIADFGGMFRLLRFLRQEKPDGLIAYTAKPVIYGTLAARLSGVKRVGALVTGLGFAFTEGSGTKRRVARIFAWLLYRIMLRRASCVIFQNEDDRALFMQLKLIGQKQTSGIVNGSGVDLAQFQRTALPEEPVFLMIGRLLGDKGVREYATAAAALLRQVPGARALLVGWRDTSPDAVSAEELETWQSNGIEYLGRLADVRPALAAASVVVLPSYREGTPRSVLEGMAMGRAIITTDAPGCRNTVAHGINGFKVPPRNAQALEMAMLTLARDARLRSTMGAASCEMAERLFEAGAVAKATLDSFGF